MFVPCRDGYNDILIDDSFLSRKIEWAAKLFLDWRLYLRKSWDHLKYAGV